MLDVAIIGGGPAALSAALNCRQRNKTVTIFGRSLDSSLLFAAEKVDNYLGLPDMDGVDLIKKVRSWSNVPIIVVSARSEDADKVNALDAGADDYLTKPFSVEELLARLRASLRRAMYQSSGGVEDNAVFENGDLKIDYASGCVFIRDEEIHLTPIEYKLLCLLAKNVGRVLTHNFILNEVWGNVMQSDVPSLRVFMATLRKKIEEEPSEPRYIQTHIGIGYRMIKRE